VTDEGSREAQAEARKGHAITDAHTNPGATFTAIATDVTLMGPTLPTTSPAVPEIKKADPGVINPQRT
jgi:hypothetical protein